MEPFLIKYGYFFLFLGVAVEGEGFLLAAAFLAHKGIFALPWVILTAIVANCIADQSYYLMARSRGRSWLQARFGHHVAFQRVVNLMGVTQPGCCSAAVLPSDSASSFRQLAAPWGCRHCVFR